MKIIHCADLHLDSKMESNLDKDQASLRRDELLDTFERMCVYGHDQGVRLILIAGDLFDKPNIRKGAKKRVVEVLQRFADIDFCYIRGNHDQSDLVNELVGMGGLTNLKLFDGDGWTSYDYDEVVVTGMELTKDNVQTLGVNLVLSQERVNIVVLHGQESDYSGKDGGEIVNLSMLRGKHIDYLALGHIHSYKLDRLDDRGVYCYSGCLEGRGFDECGPKGFVMLEVEAGKVKSEFVPMASRCLHEIPVELTPEMGMPELIAKAAEAVAEISEEDLVKLVVTGHRDMELEVDLKRMERSLGRDFFFIKSYDHSSPQIDYESFRLDRSLKGEFVRLMEEKEMSEEDRSAIIALGIKAIMGEDLGL